MSESEGSQAEPIDCRGRRCPLPVVELAKHIGDVAVGDTLGVAADDPAARHDVPAWCRMRRHELREVTDEVADDGSTHQRFTVVVGEPAPVSA